jgi:hypothetical protein
VIIKGPTRRSACSGNCAVPASRGSDLLTKAQNARQLNRRDPVLANRKVLIVDDDVQTFLP